MIQGRLELLIGPACYLSTFGIAFIYCRLSVSLSQEILYELLVRNINYAVDLLLALHDGVGLSVPRRYFYMLRLTPGVYRDNVSPRDIQFVAALDETEIFTP